jgi:hypothetical protein
MEAAIGKAAGMIWDVLQTRGKASVSQLPKLVGERDVVAYQALGWLAREGKICYRTEGNRTFVELK